MEDKEKIINVFKKVRNACDEMINGIENEDESVIETALGKFLVAIMQAEALAKGK